MSHMDLAWTLYHNACAGAPRTGEYAKDIPDPDEFALDVKRHTREWDDFLQTMSNAPFLGPRVKEALLQDPLGKYMTYMISSSSRHQALGPAP